MEPRPPKTLAIYRPDEIKTPFILRHVETLITEITAWEDYDDEETVMPARIGFNIPPVHESLLQDTILIALLLPFYLNRRFLTVSITVKVFSE